MTMILHDVGRPVRPRHGRIEQRMTQPVTCSEWMQGNNSGFRTFVAPNQSDFWFKSGFERNCIHNTLVYVMYVFMYCMQVCMDVWFDAFADRSWILVNQGTNQAFDPYIMHSILHDARLHDIGWHRQTQDIFSTSKMPDCSMFLIISCRIQVRHIVGQGKQRGIYCFARCTQFVNHLLSWIISQVFIHYHNHY